MTLCPDYLDGCGCLRCRIRFRATCLLGLVLAVALAPAIVLMAKPGHPKLRDAWRWWAKGVRAFAAGAFT